MPTTKTKQKKAEVFHLLLTSALSGACFWGQTIERGLSCEELFASCEDGEKTGAEPAVAREERPKATGAPLALRSVAFSPDGALLAVGAHDLTILVDAETREEVRRVWGSRGPNYAAFLPDGRLVTQGYQDNRSLLWSAQAGELLEEISGALACADTFGAAWRCDLSGRGMQVTYSNHSGAQEVVLSLWDGSTLSKHRAVKDRQLGYPVVLATGKNRAFAVAGKSGYPRTERRQERPWPVIKTSESGTKPACPPPHPDDMSVQGGYVRVWSSGGALDCQRLGLGSGARSVALDRSGRFLLVGDESGEVFLLDREGIAEEGRDRPLAVKDCSLARTLSAHTGAVVGVAFSPDASLGVSVDESGALLWWDLATGEHTRSSFFR